VPRPVGPLGHDRLRRSKASALVALVPVLTSSSTALSVVVGGDIDSDHSFVTGGLLRDSLYRGMSRLGGASSCSSWMVGALPAVNVKWCVAAFGSSACQATGHGGLG
jgi:hypothetical protein